MERYEVALLVHLLERLSWSNALFYHLLSRNEWVECHNLHSESLSLLSNEATYVTISLDTDFLALNLHTCTRSELVT